jgi:uncharacterized membrane protein
MLERWNNFLERRVVYFAAFLTLLVLFCFSLSALRVYYTGQLYYLFLVTNLFLALLPWVGIETATFLQRWQAPKLLVVLFLGLTILFLPNAPYLITDLCHLHWSSSSELLWLDILLIVTYSITGLVGFYATLFAIEDLVKPYLGLWGTRISLTLLLFLTGFGIYLGRFLRFNSWDLWTNPWSLFEVIGARLWEPMAYPTTWVVTLGYGGLLLVVFLGIKLWRYALLGTVRFGSTL